MSSFDWLDESAEILRVLINDMGKNPTYDDNTLEQLLLAAAKQVVQEVTLPTDYTVYFSMGEITPDPTNDERFINLIIIKAACLNNRWKFDELALLNGLRAKLGPAELSVDTGPSILTTFLEQGPCATYEDLKNDINFGDIGGTRAVVGPFRSNLYNPSVPFLGRYGRFL